MSGGILSEQFANVCGETPMVRAYDSATEAWSNWLEAEPATLAVAHYGPNGSADPALGYTPGCSPTR